MKKISAYIIIFMLLITSAIAELPVPDVQGINMHMGETYGDYYTEVKLFYESTNGMELTNVTRNVYVPVGGTVVESALEALFSTEAESDFVSSMPGDASVKSVEINCGIVTVDLSVNMSALQNEGELVSMIIAVTNTLSSIDGVDYVNVLINGRQESIHDLPVGTLSYETTATSTIWSVFQVEAEAFLNTSNPQISMTRNAALYFPSNNGQWVLPEVRSITFQDERYAYWLINELMSGPTGGNAYSSFIASGSGIMSDEPEISITASGERIIEIYFNNIVRDYLLLQDISDWQFAASITMTLTSFIPETDGVRIYIGGEPLSQLNIRGQHIPLDDSIMHRNTFAMYTGSTCTLYFAAEDNKLCATQRAISSDRANSPYALLIQLISGPSSADIGTAHIMPAGVTSGDLLGVTVENGIACVNMSANFYRLCQVLTEDEEELLVYSIVNTLCNLPGINAVSIIIEGEQIETLSGSIFLISELFMNPGIVTTAY